MSVLIYMSLPYLQNSELSWILFNVRVLEEAEDTSVPLFERLRFLSIFQSNFDEFFMTRMQHIVDCDVLDTLYSAIHSAVDRSCGVSCQIKQCLEGCGIISVDTRALSLDETSFVEDYYEQEIEPFLSPKIVDSEKDMLQALYERGAGVSPDQKISEDKHAFHQNKTHHLIALLDDGGSMRYGVLFIPHYLLEPIMLQKTCSSTDLFYLRAEDLIYNNSAKLFSGFQILEQTIISVTWNRNLGFDSDVSNMGCVFQSHDTTPVQLTCDFRDNLEHLILNARVFTAMKLELQYPVKDLGHILTQALQISERQVFAMPRLFPFGYPATLSNAVMKQRVMTQVDLFYPPLSHRELAYIDLHNIFEQLDKDDILLSYPLNSINVFLNLIEAAATTASVLSIQIILYRLSVDTKLVDYLALAVKNGKDVRVFIELRAKFDELNNINWAKKLEDAGCTVFYGFEGYKIHAKVCLIKRIEHGSIKYYTHVGTGNYHERTAEQYTDVSLMTSDKNLGADVARFFQNLETCNLTDSECYSNLLVSPANFKDKIIELIDREATKGVHGKIIMKMNALTDVDIIHHLQKASMARVSIQLIVRSICGILPGVLGYTENIRVRSIVGRFLEHSRIYLFGEGSDELVYIASADLMTKNTTRRVEVACPVCSNAAKEKLKIILKSALEDTVNARVLTSDGRYVPLKSTSKIDSQLFLFVVDDGETVDRRKTD